MSWGLENDRLNWVWLVRNMTIQRAEQDLNKKKRKKGEGKRFHRNNLEQRMTQKTNV